MKELELTTEKMVHEGKALARDGRYVIFVEGALPGERITAQLIYKKRSYAFAQMTSVIEASPHRQVAPCKVFGSCGGCSFQQMGYTAQLQMKRDILVDSLHGLPGVPDIVQDALPCESPFYFRNKMVFAFGTRNDLPILGLHKKRDWRTIVPTDICLLESPEAGEIMRRVLDFVRANDLPIYNDESEEGLLRHLVIREGKKTGDRMAHLHAVEPHPLLERFADNLDDLCTTALLSHHKTVPENAPPETTHVVKGDGFIYDELNGFRFKIGPSTFFQTNTLQAEKMFQRLMEHVRKKKPTTAVDLYCGTGPIAIHLSAVAERVVGIELNAESVEMAKHNVELNGLKNVEMICAEVQKTQTDAFPDPTDLIVVDPPRAGLHKKAMRTLLAVSPASLIYVSCNPATLARDLKLLVNDGYTLETVEPIDLFPHTFHIEAIAVLSRSAERRTPRLRQGCGGQAR